MSHTILIIITKYAKPLKFLTVYSLFVNINVSSKYAQLQGDKDQDLFVERSWNRNWLDFFSICPCFRFFFLILFILFYSFSSQKAVSPASPSSCSLSSNFLLFCSFCNYTHFCPFHGDIFHLLI